MVDDGAGGGDPGHRAAVQRVAAGHGGEGEVVRAVGEPARRHRDDHRPGGGDCGGVREEAGDRLPVGGRGPMEVPIGMQDSRGAAALGAGRAPAGDDGVQVQGLVRVVKGDRGDGDGRDDVGGGGGGGGARARRGDGAGLGHGAGQ